jgi:hypothetical protein
MLKEVGVVDWIDLAKERDNFHAFVNTVMNPQPSNMRRILRVAQKY